MPYDKTVGGDDFTFIGTLKETPSTLLDILNSADRQELLEAMYDGGNQTSKRVRVAVDGWIYSSSDFYTSHKIGGAEETITPGTRYPMPVYQWVKKRLFCGVEGQQVTVRVLLSVNYDKRDEY
jgi:hypothetical protein